MTEIRSSHMSSSWHLAQVNISRLIEPLDSERLKAFLKEIEPVNSTADAADGFIWRLKTDEGNSTSVVAFDWDRNGSAGVVTNLSVWESFESLKDFVFSPRHLEVMKQRRKWFFPVSESTTALWWIESGHIPTVQEAEGKILELRANGPSSNVFGFNGNFPRPESAA